MAARQRRGEGASASEGLEWVRPTKQSRSRASQERILEAAEELFGDKGFEATTVADIARDAGYAVGTVYSRFKDKEALLHVLQESLSEQAAATARAGLGSLAPDLPLMDVAEVLAAFLLRIYEQRPRLILAIYSRVRTDRQIALRAEALAGELAESFGAYLAARSDLRLSEPVAAADFGLRLMFAALHHRAMYRDTLGTRLDQGNFSKELARALVGYLTVASSLQ